MATAKEYQDLMKSILGGINTLNDDLRAEGHALWQAEGAQGVARWADLLPHTVDMREWPEDVKSLLRIISAFIRELCLSFDAMVAEDCK